MFNVPFHEVREYDKKRELWETIFRISVKKPHDSYSKMQMLYGVLHITKACFDGKDYRKVLDFERRAMMDDLLKLFVIYHDYGYIENCTREVYG